MLIDDAGVIAATAAHESRAGRYAFSAVVPEGRYTLRAAAIDALGREGSVERVFRARLDRAGPLSVGDLMLAPVPDIPADPLSPIVDRAGGDALVAYLELLPAGPATGIQVRVEVGRGDGGPALVSATAAVSPGDGGWFRAQALIPIAALPPGVYTATASIEMPGAAPARVARPFTIGGR